MNADEARAVIAAHQPANLVYPDLVRAEKRARTRQMAISLLGNRCLDCGFQDQAHPEVYEFDHVRGTKKYNIAELLYGRWGLLSIELKKCDLVCRNCHAKRTAHRRVGNRCE